MPKNHPLEICLWNFLDSANQNELLPENLQSQLKESLIAQTNLQSSSSSNIEHNPFNSLARNAAGYTFLTFSLQRNLLFIADNLAKIFVENNHHDAIFINDANHNHLLHYLCSISEENAQAISLLSFLFDKGNFLFSQINIFNNNKETPLYLACKTNHYTAVSLLLHNRATIDSPHTKTLSPIHALLESHEKLAQAIQQEQNNIIQSNSASNKKSKTIILTSNQLENLYRQKNKMYRIIKLLSNAGAFFYCALPPKFIQLLAEWDTEEKRTKILLISNTNNQITPDYQADNWLITNIKQAEAILEAEVGSNEFNYSAMRHHLWNAVQQQKSLNTDNQFRRLRFIIERCFNCHNQSFEDIQSKTKEDEFGVNLQSPIAFTDSKDVYIKNWQDICTSVDWLENYMSELNDKSTFLKLRHAKNQEKVEKFLLISYFALNLPVIIGAAILIASTNITNYYEPAFSLSPGVYAVLLHFFKLHVLSPYYKKRILPSGQQSSIETLKNSVTFFINLYDHLVQESRENLFTIALTQQLATLLEKLKNEDELYFGDTIDEIAAFSHSYQKALQLGHTKIFLSEETVKPFFKLKSSDDAHPTLEAIVDPGEGASKTLTASPMHTHKTQTLFFKNEAGGFSKVKPTNNLQTVDEGAVDADSTPSENTRLFASFNAL